MGVTVDLLRHGETTGNGRFCGSLDHPLTDRGWEQMRTAVGNGGPWQAVVSSPLSRCAAFAQAFAAQEGIPLQLAPDLRELHFGRWEGCSATELMESEPDALARFWNDPYGYPPPEGESLADFERRVLTAWGTLIGGNRGRRTLVVTHGGVIRLLRCRLEQLPRTALLSLDVPHATLHRIVA